MLAPKVTQQLTFCLRRLFFYVFQRFLSAGAFWFSKKLMMGRDTAIISVA